MKFTQVALLSVVSVAVAQHNHHAHHHLPRHGSPVEARDPAAVTTTVAGPVTTVYELDGTDIAYADVEVGLKDGKYVLVGGDDFSSAAPATTSVAPTTSSIPTPTPASTSTPTPSSTREAAEFIQQASSSSSTTTTSTSEEPTSTSTTSAIPTPPTTTSESAASTSSSSSSSSSFSSTSSSSSSSSSSSGSADSEFPSGSIPCSTFPSEYGAVYLDYLGLEGWSGIQKVPSFHGDLSLSTAIVTIETAISGSGGCTPNSFCSYACPAGYQKSQWPSSQGSTGESIGGLYCNSNGFLELSRTDVKQICTAGAPGVQVTNKLSKGVAICRTDYPGTESETIPLNVEAGQTQPLTNPVSADYYSWEGSATTAQYYVNPSGYEISEACIWGSAGTNLGNWAPVNIGVGVGAGDVTYISVFPNAPTNPDGVLDFSIKITGDISGSCSYTGGKYYSNGAESSTGCTVGVSSGNTATFEFS